MKKLKFILLSLAVIFAVSCTTHTRSARLVSNLTVDNNLITSVVSTYITSNGLDETVNYSDGSVRWDADHLFADTVRHTGTIDLTSLTNELGETLNLTGENIVAAKFFLADVAGATMTIANGASNSYPLLGTTYSFQLKENQSMLIKCDSILAPVSASLKNIAYTGSSDAAVLYIMLLTADSYH